MTSRACVMAVVVGLAVTATGARGAPGACAENYDHPGLVFAGKDGWLTPQQAGEKGYFQYERRWLPQSMKKTLTAWEERKDVDYCELESKHYRITSHHVPRFILELEIVPFLDALYDKYTQVFKTDFGVSGKGTNKNWIRIYNGFERYAWATRDYKTDVPRSRNNPGFFSPSNTQLTVYYDEADPGLFYSTVFHEEAHQFVAGLLPGATLPIWLNEGLAVYFEGCAYSRASKTITVDHLPPDRVAEAQSVLASVDASDASLAQRLFMDVTTENFTAREYALAWSFVHFLINSDGGKSRAAFARFLRAMNGSGTKPAAVVFEETTKLSLRALQGGWRDYVLAWKVPEVPCWAILEVEGTEGPASGVRQGDKAWSLGGVEVRDADAFNALWEKRATDQPTELVVIRRTTKVKNAWAEYRDYVATLTVPAGVTRRVVARSGGARTFNLKD